MTCQNENNSHFRYARRALSALSSTSGTNNSLRQNGLPETAVSKGSNVYFPKVENVNKR